MNNVLTGDFSNDYESFYNDAAFSDEVAEYADVTTEFDAQVDAMLGQMQHAFY